MSIRLDWPTEVVDGIQEEAQEKGMSVDAYILDAVHKNGSKDAPVVDAETLRIRRKAIASIRKLRKENVLGPELTIRDLVQEGRWF